jgi:flavorubredoxin
MSVVKSGIEPIVDGKVSALGACVENDGMISWVPSEAPGFVWLNCYLVAEGRTALLVDTGVPALEGQIAAQLRQFDVDSVTIAFTRFGEFDSVGNAEVIERIVPVEACYAYFPPRDYVYLRGDGPAPEPSFESRLFPEDGALEVGPARPLTVLPTRLKLLPTAWLYDHAAKTLFTSDAFSHALTEDPDTRVITDERDGPTPEALLRHLLCKWDWLVGADTEPVRAYLDETFTTYDVQTIAPSSGCVLKGPDVVRRQVEMLDAALVEVGA